MINSETTQRSYSLEYIKKQSIEELITIASDLRAIMVTSLLQSGGHLSSNLGSVELILAWHYVFDSPQDKLIFDVGHQCYVHKILTDRLDKFSQIRQLDGISGFPRRQESEHDIVSTGHASASLGVAAGIVAGQEEKIRKKERVTALVGDAGLTGGVAFEALNDIGHRQLPVILLLNDNQMSITSGCGALHTHLEGIDTQNNLFTNLGWSYIGVYDGHNLAELIEVLTYAKTYDRPLVIHTKTQKGKGYLPAELDPIKYHGVAGSNQPVVESLSYTQAFANSLLSLAKEHSDVVAITAAMSTGTGISQLEAVMPHRCYDVGIAEQYAISFASGLALSGKKPIVALYATFLQRAIDQVIHDVVMQQISMVITLDRAGLVAGDGESHQGIYDIALLQSLPSILFMAPASQSELESMLFWAMQQCTLVVIRFPKAHFVINDNFLSHKLSPITVGCGEYWYHDDRSVEILIVSLGAMTEQAMLALPLLEELGIRVHIYHSRFITPIDESHWMDILARYRAVLTIEEGVLSGGWGVNFAARFSLLLPKVSFHQLGVRTSFLPQATREELLRIAELDATAICSTVTTITEELLHQDRMNSV
ncbi:1-deoxy-D-xylulose-5-phosphate synthase [Entomospira nematocerorum]|uniref:1-deoxy-D-xylulose-5-phosphate synthase n=1 Tax=Entomospira nematocerorum TaxID=2719987 RepID=A0A968GAI9_9SPIO|nr:1-deoxy-D-xylulose-5-phosphate synthase [Entomospira nematocera]NIZ46340.1 1-deoxy-D-xylulose-5-phosphate synthase [Entomospira nematocera]WDI33856.1 1-deoxy-D-xylulose-5-phosphate synthase [Entomospira nematocera]